MDYEDAVRWLYDRQGLGIKLGLEKVHRLLELLGNPHQACPVIHVAGTNGKGSVTAMLAAVLQDAGFRVGTTTSPHLIEFTERIQINGESIAKPQVARLVALIQPAVSQLDQENQHPTFFECVTALAFLHFAAEQPNWIIVETGMGGRLDATNVVEPILTIITSIGLDHQAFLGDTLIDITWEKAGIMKRGVPCITAAKNKALFALKARSLELQIPMSIVGEDYLVREAHGAMMLSRPTGTSMYQVGLAGRHQMENAALVVAACDALTKRGVFVPERAMQTGLAHARHPGRADLRTIDAAPWGGNGTAELLIDGAHNEDAARALATTMQGLAWKDATAIVGFCRDKATQECLDTWQPHITTWHPTVLRNPRSLQPKDWGAILPESPAHANAQAALRTAIGSGAKQILVAGSLFLAGEIIALLEHRSLEEIRGSQ